MSFQKNDLYYKDYVWTTRDSADDPKVTGEPDSTLFARTEGWEMLYLVNKLVGLWNWANSLANYHKIERAIRDDVPREIVTQREIKQWLDKNLK